MGILSGRRLGRWGGGGHEWVERTDDARDRAFGGVDLEEVPRRIAERIGTNYRLGRFDCIFPLSPSIPPPLPIARRRLLSDALSSRMRARPRRVRSRRLRKRGNGVRHMILFGPEGSGKTTILNAYAEAVQAHGGLVVRLPGGEAMQSEGRLLHALAAHPFVGVYGWPVRDLILSSSLGDALRTLIEEGARPLMLVIDDAHMASPGALASLLRGICETDASRSTLSVGLAMAGSPGILDMLRDDNVRYWGADLLEDEDCRAIAVPNDLPPEASAAALSATLGFANVAIESPSDLEAAVEACGGSPKRLAMLGAAALDAAAVGGHVANFVPGGTIDIAVRSAVGKECQGMLEQLEAQNLLGSTRQVGALWRHRGGAKITDRDLRRCIASGLKRWPPREEEGRYRHHSIEVDDALRDLQRLGVIWQADADRTSSPWLLGMPGFFEFVENGFQDLASQERVAHGALLALDADLLANLGISPTSAPPPRPPDAVEAFSALRRAQRDDPLKDAIAAARARKREGLASAPQGSSPMRD